MAKKKSGGKLTSSASGSSSTKLFIIDDETLTRSEVKDNVFRPRVDGELKGHGLVPRDYAKDPRGMFAPPSEIKVYPKSEWSGLLKEKAAEGSLISQFRDEFNIPSLDQGQVGYCWSHSSTHVVELVRAINHNTFIPLSAYSVAATIKNGKDEGGWCGLSAKFIKERGVMPQSIWPQGKRNYRDYDNEANWKKAAEFRATEDWIDVSAAVYDQNLAFNIVASLLLANQPCAVDFNWWGHSVCAMDLVEVESGSFGLKILNSWSDQWGEKGTGVLRGSKAIPDGAICLRVVGAAA